LLLAAALQAATAPGFRVLDDFERIEAWQPVAAEGVQMRLGREPGKRGNAMRLDFDFRHGGGYAIAHRALALQLPPNYLFSFWIRGRAAPNTLEFKLLDASGENVWWYTQRDRTFDGRWHRVTIRRRQIVFAWGPRGGGSIAQAAAIELVITAGEGGGRGTVWFDELTLTALADAGPDPASPAVVASAWRPGYPPSAVLDGDTATAWRAPGAAAMLTLDFQSAREYGGLTLVWEPGRAAQQYRVRLSDDGRRWRTVARGRAGMAPHDYVRLTETGARFLRIELFRPQGREGFGVAELRVAPAEWAESSNAFFAALARQAPRGIYPRYFLDEQVPWTVVGVAGGRAKALLSQDGAVEAAAGGFSVEPFLALDGRFLTWSDVSSRPRLADYGLPIPSVEWQAGAIRLAVTAVGLGPLDRPSVLVRYRIYNDGSTPLSPTLYLALRPFQVNPPWQSLRRPGGATRISRLRWDGRRVLVDGQGEVRPLDSPARVGAAAFASGDVVDQLRRGAFPSHTAVRDPLDAASGVLAWPLSVAPADSASVALQLSAAPGASLVRGASSVDSVIRVAASDWQRALSRATIRLPPAGEAVARSISTTLGYILINRDGPAIQPGARAYQRSWIRDGALISAALLRFGCADEVREFLRWFASFQYPSGKVPCCVDRRGADPVPEHDSNGEFIWLAAEYYRHTGDRALVAELWPRITKAVAYLDSLRRTQRTEQYTQGERRFFFGLLPPSISHEGYSAKPVHSYWDDFWALRGFRDAGALADILGHAAEGQRLAALAREFASDLYASIHAVMERHAIDYVPGSAELGDFDPTSTTIAVSPGGELDGLPRQALEHTFTRYWSEVEKRRGPGADWEAYTPYEFRAVGTLLRLGWKGRALQLLEALLADQWPPGWHQWPEIVYRNRQAPKFIGDVPHTWVGADFLRSVADLFAYERESDSTLVVAAGIPEPWLDGEGVTAENLSTWWGPLSYRAGRTDDGVSVTIAAGLRVPPGGLLVHPPGTGRVRGVLVDGIPAPTDSLGAVRVRALPASLVFER